MTILRDEHGHFLPGESPNPTGRPKLKVQLTKLLAQKLDDEPATAQGIVNAWIKAAQVPDLRAIELMLDRTEGKVPSEVNLRALIIQIGDDYAREGLEAVRNELLERQTRYLLPEGTPESTKNANRQLKGGI